jgi:hypothetical protein
VSRNAHVRERACVCVCVCARVWQMSSKQHKRTERLPSAPPSAPRVHIAVGSDRPSCPPTPCVPNGNSSFKPVQPTLEQRVELLQRARLKDGRRIGKLEKARQDAQRQCAEMQARNEKLERRNVALKRGSQKAIVKPVHSARQKLKAILRKCHPDKAKGGTLPLDRTQVTADLTDLLAALNECD